MKPIESSWRTETMIDDELNTLIDWYLKDYDENYVEGEEIYVQEDPDED